MSKISLRIYSVVDTCVYICLEFCIVKCDPDDKVTQNLCFVALKVKLLKELVGQAETGRKP